MGLRPLRLKCRLIAGYRLIVISHCAAMAYFGVMTKIRPPYAPRLVFAFWLGLLTAGPGLATSLDEILDAALLPGWQMENGHHMSGLALTLAPQWKTYWRAPGEAGIPPLFDWSGSENVKSVRIHWPSPEVFHTNGMQTVGYHDGVILPLEVTPIVPGKPIMLRARVDLGVCKDICMPAAVDVRVGLADPGQPDAAIRAALKARPVTAAEAGLAGIKCSVAPIDDGLRLTATLDLPRRGGTETVVFETRDASVWVAEAMTSRTGGVLTSVTEMVTGSGAPFALDRSGVTVTVLSEGRAVEIAGCPAP
jgi:DsbC/DsbD-like thiol-disulfide interchange protein